MPLPITDQNFLGFIQFFGQFYKIICWRPYLEGWHPLQWRILDPPQQGVLDYASKSILKPYKTVRLVCHFDDDLIDLEARGTTPPPRPVQKFFIFMQFSGTIDQIVGWHPRRLEPPLGNPGSTTGLADDKIEIITIRFPQRARFVRLNFLLEIIIPFKYHLFYHITFWNLSCCERSVWIV